MAQKKKTLKDEGKLGDGSNSEPLTAEEISKKYTVAELRYILKENGLKTSGKKQELVERVLPILNDDSSETSDEDVSVDDVNLPIPANEQLLRTAVSVFGMDYDELAINDKISKGDEGNLDIQGFTQNGLCMSDSTMSIVAASDSSNIDLKINIPEVSYTNFESTIFTFKNLDLCILPSSDPQGLEFSAVMDSLEIITETNYVNLRGLDLSFKSFPDDGVSLAIDIDSFLYPDFNDATIQFENLDFDLAMGIDGQSLNISVNLPKLNLLNKNYRVDLSDLDLNVALSDTKLSNLDLSIVLPYFHYTNFDDVVIDMVNVDVALDPTVGSNSVNVLISMDGLNATGLNSFDNLFPMMEITDVNFKKPANDLESPINLTCLMHLLDVTQMDLTSIGALLSSGFDLDTYMRNMPDYGSLGGDVEESGFDILGLDLGSIFENCDYSSLDAIKLNLTGLLDSLDIDLDDFGVDVSDYDLSAISLSDLIGAVGDSDFVNSAATAVSKLFGLDFESFDLSGLIVGFDSDKFDISSLLVSLNLEDVDISGIIEMFNNSDVDFAAVFKNCDYSCLGAIKLDLTGLLDSLGIDLADFGLDIEGIDWSAISLSDLIGIVSNLDIDMSTITTVLKLFGLDFDNIDLSGLIASFDADNFDISSLLKSLNLDKIDVTALVDLLTKLDVDWEGIFENCDYSCLGAIELNLSGLIGSLGIDLADLGIDLGDIDLSAISLSELIDVLTNLDIDLSTVGALLKLFDIDLDDLDLNGLIKSFDVDNFDMSSLLQSLNLDKLDVPALAEMFANSDVDWDGIFENCDYSSLDGMVLDLTGVLESSGIDLADLGVDVSDYDLSAIALPDLIDVVSNLDIDMSEFDLESLDLSGLIASFDADNFDISSLLESLNLDKVDVTALVDMLTKLDVDWEGIFENCDYSCLGAIELNLSGLIDSLGIDLADLGIDLGDIDLSAISLSELIDVLTNLDIDLSTVGALLKLFDIDLDDLDLDGLIKSFDVENFDLSTLLDSIDLGDLDISAIVGMFTNSDVDLAGIFENCDYSCLGAINLDLTGVFDSLGVDLAEFGLDIEGIDWSAISLSDLIGIVSNLDIDMSIVAVVLKLFGLDLDDLDLDGLIKSFDTDNFDMSSLLASLNLSGLDISGMADMFSNMDIDLEGIFENFDDSCLGAIVLDLTGLIDSLGIDLADFDIDVSDYDLSAISLADFVDALCDSEFIKTAAGLIPKLFSIDLENLDWEGLIASFDADSFDISSLVNSLNLPEDISSMLAMFDMNGVDLTEFLNNLICMFMEKSVPEITE